ncbi:MAG: SAM-dependent methyltransferase [Parvibaculaceae bacterium]|nr:SAM-dependent methyltransferase [Parvibaculaceae bacterium]
MNNPVADHLRRLIEIEGPVPVADYMAIALGHPQHGYYMRQDPLGAGGDFITAPEVSQMFGELVGLWIAAQWLAQGAPESFVLAEAGPGRGTLMADALRATARVPGFSRAAEVHFIETSPVLRAAQAVRVPHACWHDTLDSVPEGPLFLIANEFFDALPVRQFVRTERGWCERCVALDVTGERFEPVLAPVAQGAADLLPPDLRDAPAGSLAEISPASEAIARQIASRVAAHGGAALIIDYGHARSGLGDTLQAVRAHAYADPFADPGLADLTAHVDFEALGQAAQAAGATVHGPVEQGALLFALGIESRCVKLKAGASQAQCDRINTELDRLTGADQMGHLFKAMAITPRNIPVPDGF